MKLSVTTDDGDLYNLEIDSQMEIENLKALLEAEVSSPFMLPRSVTAHLTVKELSHVWNCVQWPILTFKNLDSYQCWRANAVS